MFKGKLFLHNMHSNYGGGDIERFWLVSPIHVMQLQRFEAGGRV